MKLNEAEYQKTAFRTPFGLYEYKVLPFGLTNAPSAFMSIINEVIADLPFAVVYLDDILIFSKTPEDHVRHVEEILNRLRLNHFFLKMKKCEFFESEIPFLGHLITRMIHNQRNRFNPSRGEFFQKGEWVLEADLATCTCE